MSAEEVAKAFVQHFYNTFDSNVEGLAGLYVSVCFVVVDSSSSSLRFKKNILISYSQIFHFIYFGRERRGLLLLLLLAGCVFVCVHAYETSGRENPHYRILLSGCRERAPPVFLGQRVEVIERTKHPNERTTGRGVEMGYMIPMGG